MTLDILKRVYYHSPMSVLVICIHSNQFGVKTGHFSDPMWDIDNFSLFEGYFGPNLANFSSQMTLNTLKRVYYHSRMSVIGICIISNQLRMEREHFSDPRLDFDNFSLF